MKNNNLIISGFLALVGFYSVGMDFSIEPIESYYYPQKYVPRYDELPDDWYQNSNDIFPSHHVEKKKNVYRCNDAGITKTSKLKPVHNIVKRKPIASQPADIKNNRECEKQLRKLIKSKDFAQTYTFIRTNESAKESLLGTALLNIMLKKIQSLDAFHNQIPEKDRTKDINLMAQTFAIFGRNADFQRNYILRKR